MSYSLINYHEDLTVCRIFSSMSWERRRFLPAPDPLRSVHPVWQPTVTMAALNLCTALSIWFALEPICRILWHARECMLQLYQPCDRHATTSDDDDNEDIWSVVINSWWHHDLGTLSAFQTLTKGQKFGHMTFYVGVRWNKLSHK